MSCQTDSGPHTQAFFEPVGKLVLHAWHLIGRRFEPKYELITSRLLGAVAFVEDGLFFRYHLGNQRIAMRKVVLSLLTHAAVFTISLSACSTDDDKREQADQDDRQSDDGRFSTILYQEPDQDLTEEVVTDVKIQLML